MLVGGVGLQEKMWRRKHFLFPKRKGVWSESEMAAAPAQPTPIGPTSIMSLDAESTPSVRDAAASIVPDGGIIKIPIRPALEPARPQTNSASSIWVRGANARIHYTVHAYVSEDAAAAKSHEHEHHHHHDHNHTCADKSCKETKKKDDDATQHQHDISPETMMRKKALASKTEQFRKLLDMATSKKQGRTAAPTTEADKTNPPANSKPPVRRQVADSHGYYPDGRPFDLRIGYNFSVRAMELCVTTMRVGERARFLCMPQYCENFVQLETVLRQERQNRINAEKGVPPLRIGGCCAHATAESLDLTGDLIPVYGAPLEFDIELIEVQPPSSFTREPWEMSALEKYREAPIRKDEGGDLYRRGDFTSALKKYERALVLLETLSTSSEVADLKREKFEHQQAMKQAQRGHFNTNTTTMNTEPVQTTSEIDLNVIDSLTSTCRLNYAACKLKLEDYPAVIVQCTEVLKHGPSIKALFRRAQAYRHNGRDLDLAEKDLDTLENVLRNGCGGGGDSTVYASDGPEWTEYHRERVLLRERFKMHESKEKQMFGRMFS